jgi:glycosyltransferase involved in cell wall biosynthesis
VVRAGTWGRNAKTGRCRGPIVREGGRADNGCSVNWAFVPSMLDARRLSWEKGADIFLEAVARLKDLPIAVSVLGDGAERRSLDRQARRLGTRSLVTWYGTFPAASRLFPGFDAFAITSRREGTLIGLFEAMGS